MALTLSQVQAAQANDLIGLGAVAAEMETRIERLAATYARKVSDSCTTAEDLAQDAREALFVVLPRATGDDVDRIIGFLYSSIEDVLKDKVREARYAGADKDAVKVFMGMMERADGNAHKAAELAQTEPRKGVRLSADRANAARLAWQGNIYLDRPAGDGETSLADTLAAPLDETPDEIRPKVGHGAALEALAVLHRYSAARSVLSALPAKPDDVDAIEETLTVPREAFARKAVLDAVAILRSYVSTVADGELADELRDVSDDRRELRAATIARVHTALNGIRKSYRIALNHCFGIGGVEEFGFGDACDAEGMAAHLGQTLGTCKVNRSNARKEFAAGYVNLVATSATDRLSWELAAAEMRKQGGRK